jgi:hypothetical protein
MEEVQIRTPRLPSGRGAKLNTQFSDQTWADSNNFSVPLMCSLRQIKPSRKVHGKLLRLEETRWSNVMNVSWIKCRMGDWCPLETLNLESVGEAAGVYVIWHEGSQTINPRVVRVGQGEPIKGRLSSHRCDKAILAYGKIGTLRVTWAAVPAAHRNGVERFLGETLNPLVGSTFPNALPLAVNYPW